MTNTEAFTVAGERVEPSLNRVGRDHVEPRVMEVLVYLAERAGTVVSRHELLDVLWNGTAVGDEALTRAVSKLRKAFGDDRVIETIPKRGYRLIAPVSLDASFDVSLDVSGDSSRSRRPVLGVAAGLVIIAGVYAAVVETPTDVASLPLNARPLTSFPGREIQPALSPDGESVAFAWQGDGGNNWDIYIQELSRRKLTRVTDTPAHETRPAFSPDGERIAFLWGDDGSCNVVTRRLDSGEERLVAACSGAAPSLAWSPDGRWLVYGRDASLYRLSLENGAEATLTTPLGTAEDRDPAFSPDGTHVAFVRSTAFDVQDIYTVASDGSGEPRRVSFDRRMIRGLT